MFKKAYESFKTEAKKSASYQKRVAQVAAVKAAMGCKPYAPPVASVGCPMRAAQVAAVKVAS